MEVVLAPFPVRRDVDGNLARMRSALDASGPGDLVVFPEGALSGYPDDLSGLAGLAPDRLRQALDELHVLASSRGVHVVLGTLWPEGDGWVNAAAHLGPAGERQWYQKVNLATHERGVLTAGPGLPVFHIGGVLVGIQICRELRYPEQWRWLSLQGAKVLIHVTHAVGAPQALPVWRSHLVSRAAENQRFVVSVNTADERQMCPSMVVGPRGDVRVELTGARAETARASLDVAEVSDWYISQPRTDLLALAPPKDAPTRGGEVPGAQVP